MIMDGVKIILLLVIFGPIGSSGLKQKKKTLVASSFSASFVRRSSSLSLRSKSSHFVVVSEGQYDHDHHTHHAHEDHEVLDPHFTSNNVSVDVYLGTTATLDCTIHDISNESVSWLRRVDDNLELLTWETHTYSKDSRYSLVQESGEKWQRWQLVIREAQVSDEGQYRCQVATQPPMLLILTLNVTEPRVRVVDERGTKVQEKHYNSGSMIELKCIIECVPFPHGPVTWKRGQESLTFNTSIGGISVKGNEETGYIRSRLYVANASPTHSCVYSCWYNNYSSDAVTVHVIAGENSAAMQDDKVPGQPTSTASSLRPSSQSLTCLSHLTWLSVPVFTCFLTSSSDSLVRSLLQVYASWFHMVFTYMIYVDTFISLGSCGRIISINHILSR